MVELKPQEDAMLRSRSLLSADHNRPTHSTLPERTRLGSEHFLLLAALGALIASAPSVSGQADNPTGGGQRASSQAQICDGLKHSDPHQLSLAIAKPQSFDEGTDAPEQQSTSQGSSELTNGDVRLPEVRSSSSTTQEQVLLCKKKKSGTEPVDPVDPSLPSKQAADKEAVSTVPTVSYADGELTVNAQNARLGDVIEAIRVRTGISVEFLSESMNDRVFDRVGPAPLRDALTKLLYGSGLNYVIQTSSQNPQIVTKLVLSAQPQVAATGPPRQANQPVTEQADNQASSGGAGLNNEAPVLSVQPVQNPSAIGIPVGFNIQQAATASGKTTGQILDELQKQQQQVLDNQAPPQ
jgi:hypothetical protein